ncbi:aromatic ring-hydroxylating oxygenase subunit alpha [Azospirillum thermophilum]|uniref:(2Fe-2S)-binding protein n=1 Tax=Azospirillum thermophilum TaxID=2202148 RepID=A0A2S2D0K8_9PROT|nr:SRPBCC family protein [Azospirillum thermophilum]AWK90225.1 (2Fe-2S)-binding protein [Azospirillum thermophilum]
MQTHPNAPDFQPRKAVPGIPPAAYHDPALFRAEEERIFRRCWIFAGFTDELCRHNDYVTRRLGGVDVVVQNFEGVLRGFRNVCTHRFAIIQTAPRGNGMLRCSYHGWTFDRDGVPYGIPGNEAWFGLDREARCARALTPVAVAACGRFVFVRVAAEGPPLDDWLGPCGDVLRHASEIFLRPFDEREFVWQANWKMGVESVLEVYHADTVHPATFRKLVKGDWRCDYEGGTHSRGVTSISDKSARWWDGVAERLGFRPSPRLREYDHLHLFPNLEIGFTRGTVMSVQTYDPLGPDRCALRLRLFLADPGPEGGGKGGEAARRAIEATARELNIALLREDQEASESAFRGAGQSDSPALLGLNEERIQQFHAVWRSAMGDAA